ncbi:hypothetical protein [Microbacterium sp. GXF6406]
MTIAIDSYFGTEQPYALSTKDPDAHWTDTVVSQGHADYCATYGHATFAVASTGKLSERCGRCSELLADATPTATVDTEPDATTPRTVLIGVNDNQGYAPDQISTHITLGAVLQSIQDAIDEFGEDAKVVLNNGQRHGASYGAFVRAYGNALEITDAEQDEEAGW